MKRLKKIHWIYWAFIILFIYIIIGVIFFPLFCLMSIIGAGIFLIGMQLH